MHVASAGGGMNTIPNGQGAIKTVGGTQIVPVHKVIPVKTNQGIAIAKVSRLILS